MAANQVFSGWDFHINCMVGYATQIQQECVENNRKYLWEKLNGRLKKPTNN
jgi:hypothetical protein